MADGLVNWLIDALTRLTLMMTVPVSCCGDGAAGACALLLLFVLLLLLAAFVPLLDEDDDAIPPLFELPAIPPVDP